MRQRFLSIRTVLLLATGMLTLLIALLVAREVWQQWQHLVRVQSLKQAVLLSDQLFEAAEKLSIERDVAFTMLYAPDRETVDNLQEGLQAARREADAALQAARAELHGYDFPELGEEFQESEAGWQTVVHLREEVDRAIALSRQERDPALPARWFKEATSTILQTQDAWLSFIRHFMDVDPLVTLRMRFKYYLGAITEYTGRERALIGRMIVENADPTPEEQADLLRWRGTVDLAWSSCKTLAEQGAQSAAVGPYLKDAESHYLTLYDMVRDIFYIPGAKHGASYPIGADLWLELATQATDSLYALKEAALKETRAYVEMLEAKAERAILMQMSLLLLALLICLYSFHLITDRVLRPVNAMVDALIAATRGETLAVATPAADRPDEIGKLAHVLQVFQRNAEDIRRSSIMLERYTHDLERSNKELDDFAYIASHDLKEPLRGIHNHARFLLEDNQEKLDEESVSRLGRLVYLSQRMERLVNDLLYFSRLGRQDLAIQQTDLNAVMHDIENTLDVFLGERHAKILVPKPLPTLTCDTARVTELFRNLITNAVKYNDKPEKTVEIGFLEAHAPPGEAPLAHVFYVKDDGRGIAEEFYQEVFRIFKRLQAASAQEEGTGVGLTFVKKIIERHGGRIWLESAVGKGTTFYFTLEGGDHDAEKPA